MSINQAQAQSQSPSKSTPSHKSNPNPNPDETMAGPENTSTLTRTPSTTTHNNRQAGPKHHTYPNTSPPSKPKYNPIPPDVTPESTVSVSQEQHDHHSPVARDSGEDHDTDVSQMASEQTGVNDTDAESPVVDQIAILNSVAPPSLDLPHSMSLLLSLSLPVPMSPLLPASISATETVDTEKSVESSKHGSPTVSPSPSSLLPSVSGSATEGAMSSASTEGEKQEGLKGKDKDEEKGKKILTLPTTQATEDGQDEMEVQDIPDGGGEYLEKSITFWGGQALPFAIEEEDEPVSCDGDGGNGEGENSEPSASSVYSTASGSGSGTASAAKSEAEAATQKEQEKVEAERTRSFLSIGSRNSKDRKGQSLSTGKETIKGRSIRKRIKRMFTSSKGVFKGSDRVQI